MPKRTNLFQEVVYLIQSHLAEGAEVKESEELVDLLTGARREVDVCIYSVVGGHRVIVGVECRDHKRKQAVGWVDEMHTKHQRLPTNVLVLASSSGFTKEALRAAEKYGIETVVPNEVDDSFGEQVADRLKSLWFKSVTPRPEKVVVAVEATGDLPEQNIVMDPDILVFPEDGSGEPFTIGVYVGQMLREMDFQEVMRDATGDESHFSVVLTPGSPLFLRKEDEPVPLLRRITSVRITGPATVEVAEMPLTHGELLGTQYAFGTVTTSDIDALFVVTQPDWKVPKKSGATTIRVRRVGKAAADDASEIQPHDDGEIPPGP